MLDPSVMLIALPLDALHGGLLIAALLALWPSIVLAKQRSGLRDLLFIAMLAGGLLSLDLHYLNYWHYRGVVKSIAIGLGLWSALILWASLPSAKQRLPFNRPLAYALMLYGLSLTLSLIHAPIPMLSILACIQYFSSLLWAWVLWLMIQETHYRRLLIWVLTMITLFQCVLAARQILLFEDLRAYGSTAHPNIFAAYTSIIGMIMLAYAVHASRQQQRQALYFLGCYALCFVLLLSSASRAGLAAFLLGSLALLFSLGKRRPISSNTIIMLSILGVSIGFLLFPEVLHRLLYAPSESFSQRLAMISIGWQMIVDHPLGIGANQYSYAINFIPTYRDQLYVGDRGVLHQVFLLQWLELGLWGLLAFLALWLIPLKQAWSLRQINNPWPAACIAVSIVCAAHGFFDWVLLAPEVQHLWLMTLVCFSYSYEKHLTNAKQAR